MCIGVGGGKGHDAKRNIDRFFGRTPANCITLRSSIKAQIDGHSLNVALDVRINRQNFTRGLAIHVPSTSPREVSEIVRLLSPSLVSFSNFELGEPNVIPAAAPDVAIGSGIKVDDGDVVRLIEQAPWIPGDEEIECRDFALSQHVFVYCDCDELSDALAAAREEASLAGFHLIFFGQRYLQEMTKGQKPAFFISYDARNRENAARPIAARLTNIGEPLWFDDFNLRPGDNLRQTIEDGLRRCKKCVLLITPEFVANEAWARVEFDAIFAREVAEKRKIIVPVWIDVSRSDVARFSMSLANKFAIATSFEEIAEPAGVARVAHAITTAR